MTIKVERKETYAEKINYIADFIEKYNFFDLLQAFIYPYEDPCE